MIELGLVGIVDKGTWDASETYNEGNFVLYDGSTYLVTQDGVHGITPSGDSQYYKYLARGVDATDSGDITVVDSNGLVEPAGAETNVQALFSAIEGIVYAGSPTSATDLVTIAGNVGSGRTFLASVGSGLGTSLGLTNTGQNGLLIGRLNGNASTGRVDYILAGGSNFAWGNVACSNKAVTNHNMDVPVKVITVRPGESEGQSIAGNGFLQVAKTFSLPTGYDVAGTMNCSSYASGVIVGGCFAEYKNGNWQVAFNCFNMNNSAVTIRPGCKVLLVKSTL